MPRENLKVLKRFLDVFVWGGAFWIGTQKGGFMTWGATHLSQAASDSPSGDYLLNLGPSDSEDGREPAVGCRRKTCLCATKFFSGLVLTGLAGFALGGGVGAMGSVGVSWLFSNTMTPIPYKFAVGCAKIGSCMGIAGKAINGLYRAPHAGLFDYKVSFRSYLSKLLGGG